MDPSIYGGNNQLCGPPILKPCPGDTAPQNGHHNNEGDSGSDDGRVWFYAGLGPGLFVGFLGFCVSLHFSKTLRYPYFRIIDQVFEKAVVSIAILWRKFQI